MLLGFSILNLIDIFLVALLLFYLYKMMRESGSLNLFIGILIFVVVWMLVTQVFEMPMLGSILNALANVGILALIVIFQNEIRHFFRELGSQKRFKRFFRFLRGKNRNALSQDWLPLVRACQDMSDGKVGALIVLERDQHLGDYIETGERIDANLNRMLIENLFFKNSPPPRWRSNRQRRQDCGSRLCAARLASRGYSQAAWPPSPCRPRYLGGVGRIGCHCF